MTHRVHPYIFRIGETKTWKSRWFQRKEFQRYLREDTMLRAWLTERLRQSHIDAVEIERAPGMLHIILKTSRPGILIGRGGEGVERLKQEIRARIMRLWKRWRVTVEKQELKLTVEEVRAPESHAAIAAEIISDELERRIPFRRVLKQMLEKAAASKGVLGVKIALKGRLDGAEMARYQWVKRGRIPLQTLRADIDYAERTARTSYGTIGVKVWIYKGDVFEKKVENSPDAH